MYVRSNQIILEKINNIKKSDSEDKIRIELYSIIAFMILSKDIFPNNNDIKNFLQNKDDIFKDFKPYLYLSRNLLLGRVIRIISEQEKRFLYNLSLDLKDKISSELVMKKESNITIKKETKGKDANPNYIDSLFERFKREE